VTVTPGVGARFGRYRLDALLGRGGMGEVYRAYHLDQRRVVALKLLREELGEDAEFRVRFRREAQVAARLTEAHIVPIHTWGRIEGRLYLDMRYIEGADLSDRLARAGPLPPTDAAAVVSQIAGALDAIHRAGLVHRDVKPSNIRLVPGDAPGEGDFAYLIDFGVARALSSPTMLTRAGTAVGTFDYMAPERFLEHPIDHRVDVYSLGCVLYECLTGLRPFPLDDLPQLMTAHLRTPPPLPSRHAAVPSALDGVVVRAMAKDPERRYASAGALAAATRTRAVPPPSPRRPARRGAPRAVRPDPGGVPPVRALREVPTRRIGRPPPAAPSVEPPTSAPAAPPAPSMTWLLWVCVVLVVLVLACVVLLILV
jgi:serine/threonine-protein kinase